MVLWWIVVGALFAVGLRYLGLPIVLAVLLGYVVAGGLVALHRARPPRGGRAPR